ncbi:hypothetical protein QQ73_09640, partial [Candidatus Endoriftia persephone str. Guaymas]|nr:hypothetical protein [Candidatus Endoriftia persephone str. Guaymas]
ADLMDLPGLGPAVADPQVCEQLEVQAKYAGYIERQRDEIERTSGRASRSSRRTSLDNRCPSTRSSCCGSSRFGCNQSSRR